MTNTPPPNDPLAYQEWVKQLEKDWKAGLIPDHQAVAVILQNERGEIMLQLRDNNPNISFPTRGPWLGGVVEFGETPEQAAHRELAEETAQGYFKNVSPTRGA